MAAHMNQNNQSFPCINPFSYIHIILVSYQFIYVIFIMQCYRLWKVRKANSVYSSTQRAEILNTFSMCRQGYLEVNRRTTNHIMRRKHIHVSKFLIQQSLDWGNGIIRGLQIDITGAPGMEIPPPFLNCCLHIYFQREKEMNW